MAAAEAGLGWDATHWRRRRGQDLANMLYRQEKTFLNSTDMYKGVNVGLQKSYHYTVIILTATKRSSFFSGKIALY